MSTAPHRRTAALTAIIFGFFSIGWFQWAQAVPAGRLAVWFDLGSVLALAVAIAGVVALIRSPARDMTKDARRKSGVIVGIEFAAAFAGSVLLRATGHADYVPVLVAAVVGLHFPFFVHILGDPLLVPLGVVVTAIAVTGGVLGLTTHIAPGTVAASGTAVALVTYSIQTLVRAFRA
ncbi:MAG: hypothetical protein QOJ50_2888 [Cryptosporangiaceae bacterium]|nr:hypothetical protein [Cryptosporangiaceae bacterium]